MYSPSSPLFPSNLQNFSGQNTNTHTLGGDRQAGSSSTGSVVSSFERPNRLKAREDSNIKWVDMLEKFRNTQEKARKQSRSHFAGDEVASPPPVPEKELQLAQAAGNVEQVRGVGVVRVIPRAGTPTGGAALKVPVQTAPTRSKVGLGLGRFGGSSSKKDKKK